MGNVLVDWEFWEFRSNKVREEKIKESRYECSGQSWSGFSLHKNVLKGSKFGLKVIRKVKSIVAATKKFKVFFLKRIRSNFYDFSKKKTRKPRNFSDH